MASPAPPDPYLALGVSKDAELSTIRSAHRKLALKFHPDRIKDEAQRERGKDEFTKIQQAYELLSDPAKRSRYDDQQRLAELRKEAMMRDPPPPNNTTRAYPMRPAPQPAPTSAPQYREDGNYYEEVRQPRNTPAYEYRDPYDEPSPRTTSRKHAEYEKRAPPPPKAAEKPKKHSSMGTFMAAVAAGKMKSQAEKTRNSKADERRTDKEKKRERSDKAQTRRTAHVEASSDSEIEYTSARPSLKTSSRSKTTSHFEPSPENARRTSTRTENARDWEEENSAAKWERHHEESKAYMAKATHRPTLDRAGSDAYSYWNGDVRGSGRRSGSDNEKRPGSSKGRRTQSDDYFAPNFSKSTSSPSNLRAHVEERAPRSTVGGSPRDRDHERDRERDRERDHRRPPPTLLRSQTTPMPKTSRKDTAPAKGSGLKHGETHMHDSGYGSSSSPHTPEMRDDSPTRTAKPRHAPTTSTKYRVNPDVDGEDTSRPTRVNKIYPEYDDRKYHRSPETIIREPMSRESDRRKDKPDRPRVETTSRSKSSRGASFMEELAQSPAAPRRTGSGRYDDRPSPNISRNNSGHEKLYGEVSPEERDSSRYNRPYSAEKVNVAPRRDPQYAQYSREPMDYRENEYPSRYREAPRTTRRPSVSVGAY